MPRVSVPMEKPTHPADVALAEPAEEPLEPCLRFQGLRQRAPGLPAAFGVAPEVALGEGSHG